MGSSLTITEIQPWHHHDLATFPCATYRVPHTYVVEDMVRERLADALTAGDVSAFVAIDESTLLGEVVGTIAWAPVLGRPQIWSVPVLAVRDRWQRQGIGLQLKQHLMTHAAAEGVTHLVSVIDYDNDAMIELNRTLGAHLQLDRTRSCFNCIVPTT